MRIAMRDLRFSKSALDSSSDPTLPIIDMGECVLAEFGRRRYPPARLGYWVFLVTCHSSLVTACAVCHGGLRGRLGNWATGSSAQGESSQPSPRGEGGPRPVFSPAGAGRVRGYAACNGPINLTHPRRSSLPITDTGKCSVQIVIEVIRQVMRQPVPFGLRNLRRQLSNDLLNRSRGAINGDLAHRL